MKSSQNKAYFRKAGYAYCMNKQAFFRKFKAIHRQSRPKLYGDLKLLECGGSKNISKRELLVATYAVALPQNCFPQNVLRLVGKCLAKSQR